MALPYVPTTWKSGDLVSSTRLNKLEGGVKENSDAIVTNTGDINQLKSQINDELGDPFIGMDISVKSGTCTGSVGNKITVSSDSNWVYCATPVTAGKVYKIKFRTYNYSSELGYIHFCDADDYVLSVVKETSASGYKTFTETATAPQNAAKVYVRSYIAGTTPLTVLEMSEKKTDALQSLATLEETVYGELAPTVGDLDKTTVFPQALASNANLYASKRYAFKKDKHYKIRFKSNDWSGAGLGGTYVLVSRTTNNYVTSSTNFDSAIVDPLIYIRKEAATLNVDREIEYVPTEDAEYISYFMNAGASATVTLTITSIVEEDVEYDLTKKFSLPRILVYAKAAFYGNNAYSSSAHQATSKELVFSAPVRVVSTDDNIRVNAYFNPYATEGGEGFRPEFTIPANKPFTLAIYKVDMQDITATDIAKVELYTTPEGYEDFKSKYYYKVEETTRLRFGVSGIGSIGILYLATESLIGYRTTDSGAVGASSDKVLWSDKDIEIFVARLSSTTCSILINNEVAATIDQQESYTVPANTEFTLCAKPSGANSDIGANVIISVLESESITKYALPYFDDGVNRPRSDCAFMTEDGAVYTIGETGVYSCIVNGEFVVNGASLVGDLGHANNCNYVDGKVYVSGWINAVKDKIYVYDVDTENHTITYDKTITVPVDEGVGAMEYFVMSGERTILSVGMSDSYKSMTFCEFILIDATEGTYIKAREFKFPMVPDQAGWIQGFTYVDGKIYYVCGLPETYAHLGIGILDIGTGMTKFVPSPTTVSSIELEAIFPVAKNLFMLTNHTSQLYLHYIGE